ncbi:MAG: SPOR domain-containing protein [Bacteroidia bacterium]|nr:SPOR domain-containing protein [Bacteroidia bacterium]
MGVKIENVELKGPIIWQFIKHYLHKHNELCIVGFGRFAAQVHEFNIDPVAKKVIPSFRKIYFQPGEFDTSIEFVEFLASSLEMPSIEIVDKLGLFVNGFQNHVSTAQKVEIEGFGLFKFNVMGELEFESALSSNFDDISFGLKPIHFAANLLKTKRIVVDKVDTEEEEELTQMRESALKELKVLLDSARIADSEKQKKSSKVFPIIATVLTLILVINLGFFLFKGPVDQLKQQISKMSTLGQTEAIIDSQFAKPTPEIIAEPIAKEIDVVKPEPSKEEIIIESTPAPALETPKKDLTISPDIKKEIILSEPKIETPIQKEIEPTDIFKRSGGFDFDSTFYTQISVESIPTPTPIIDVEIQSTPFVKETPLVQTETEKYEPITEVAVEVETYDMPNMVNVDAKSNGIEKGFYVIAGAFKVPANANKFKEKLVKNGDSQAVVFKPKSHPYFLVAYKKGETLNQALNLLEKKEDKNPSIWVYCAY